eukprot:gnl/MRDRNA2_/MRDRNA2_85952_c1_seq1.p1 gnl/MRDRNA2_/MRDRNA2_85952_c1~~gnl/MRDRNA2_/MRDRNA2_85952_c1_seq1.p1  ORF type:complete len:254 (-),score=-1.42 gnl/MRDRNA2_/MRDRNA2_85952_c1_seq1:35-796(-)
MTDQVPKIEPIKVKQYEVKQSKYPQCGKLPVRSILLAPSGGGKGVLLQNMILDIYKNCFERVYIFSPSINVDMTWEPVKEYLTKHVNLKDDEPGLYYENYDHESLEKIIDTQKKITEYLKSKKETKRLFQILIIIDDHADDPVFSRKSTLLHSLFTRGRHSGISTIVSTQKFAALHPIIRVNATELFVFRLRNYQDLSMFLEEISALIDKKSLMEIYSIATNEPYSFLYVKLNEKQRNDMFLIRFDKKITIDE